MPYQMKNGQWRGKRMINGCTKTKCFGTRRDALLWEAQQNENLWMEQERPIVTVLDWANSYLDYARERYVFKVYDAKRLAFRRLFAVVRPECQVGQFAVSHAMTLMQKVSGQFGNGPANTARKHLSSAWNWGAKYLHMPRENPFAIVDRLPADQRPRRIPTEDEFWTVFLVAQGQDQVLLKTALHTAARKNELYSLLWDDVDFEGRKIRLGTRKRSGGGMEYDWIPMTDDLHGTLVAYRGTCEGQRSEYVFSSCLGERYKTRFNFMRTLCKRAGVPRFGLHAIRHLSASLLAKAGVPLPTIQYILRHRKVTTTALYIQQLGVNGLNLNGVFDAPSKLPMMV